MKIFYFIFAIVGFNKGYSQKPIIDTVIVKEFGGVGGGAISCDGRYVSYNFNDPSTASRYLVIQGVENDWKRSFERGHSAVFSADGKNIAFNVGLDTICVIDLNNDSLQQFYHSGPIKLFNSDCGNLLAFETSNPPAKLVLRNLTRGDSREFASFSEYKISNSGNYILIAYLDSAEKGMNKMLHLYDLRSGYESTIPLGTEWGSKISNVCFDQKEEQIAFLTEDAVGNKESIRLWYYKIGSPVAVSLVTDKSFSGERYGVSSLAPSFSDDGEHVFFGIREHQPIGGKVGPKSAMVDVWSYKDLTLYSSQQAEPVGEPDYACVISLATKKVVRLEQKNERIVDNHHNWIVTVRQLGLSGIFEAGWNAAATISYSLISTLDGHVEYRIDDIDNLNEGFALSPAGKWLIFYDYAKRNFFSYEIATKKIRNITKKCLTTWTKEGGDMLKPALSWYPWEKTWLLNDDAVLISDNYDIWQVDPRCIREPINLTKGFGHANHIKFEIGSNAKDLQKFSVQANSLILLSAFNRINKDMGFCKIRLNESANPEILSMGPYLYGNINSGHDDYVNSFPASLHGGRYFLVLRQSATEAPNYFLTQDFKRFDRITDFSRHKKYNWLTAELVHWKTFDGVGASGILYKPENFNPKLKYPIIFEYYEKRSDMLNLFISPKFSDGRINIPWFVSRGFLVFVPDIHYKIGQAGQSAYNSVVSAARHLSKKTWVDSNRMGLQGHSWGAYQTNYIITRTGIFKAACSASGVSDLVSAYASDRRGGYRLYHAERGQGRLGGTIWQRRTNYIKNSPIIWADRITTPLLLMNNKKDKVVPFEQGLELFLALRRLKKPVWLLQYDNGYHVLGEDCARDYTVRMTQFFDHYLKGYPVPRWMSQGVAARKKGLEDGFDLVPHGNYGSDCQICLKGEQNIKGRQPD